MDSAVEMDLPIDQLRIDGGTQLRLELSEELAQDYAENIDDLPPVDVFDDGENYWLADGFHRRLAHLLRQRTSMRCRVRPGTQRDAILFAAGANTHRQHGLQRSRQEADRAVRLVLADPEWRQWSDREIAKTCCVSGDKVASVRRELAEAETAPVPEERKFSRGGKTHTMRPRTVQRRKAEGKEPEEKAPPTSSQDMRDGLGQPIPERLRDVFADTLIQESTRYLQQLETRAKDAAQRWAKHLRLSDEAHHRGLLRALEDARYALEEAVPYAVHIRCQGQGCHGGQGCKGAGYVPEWLYRSMQDNGDW